MIRYKITQVAPLSGNAFALALVWQFCCLLRVQATQTRTHNSFHLRFSGLSPVACCFLLLLLLRCTYADKTFGPGNNNNNNGNKNFSCTHFFFFFGCDFSFTCSASFCFYFFFLSRRNKHTQTHTHTYVHTLMYFHITEEIIQYAQFPTAFYISRASERAQRSRQTHASNVEKNQSEIP